MVYRRFRRFRRQYGRKVRQGSKQAWYNKKYSVGQMASSALRGVSYLRGLVNSEKYKYDTSVSITATSTGVLHNLTTVAVGDGDNSRTGNSIFVRGLSIQGNTSRNASGTYPDGQVVRIMLVKDGQQISDTAPQVTDILETASVNSFLNSDTVGRFTVLWNKKYKLDTQNPNQLIKYNKTLWHHVRYNGTSGSDIQKGGLYLLIISNESVYGPAMGLQCRLSYHDN